MEFIYGRVPPQVEGGFHFPQLLHNGSYVHITGSTKEELDAKTLSFRVANGLPVGNVDLETTNYLCAKWPDYCREVRSTEADESPGGKTLLQRTTNWRYNRYAQLHSNTTLEEQEVADARAKICAVCPKNQDNKDGCPPCVAENERVLFMIRQGHNPSTKLGGCAATGQDNSTAVFLKPEMLTYAQRYKDELPDFCWLPR